MLQSGFPEKSPTWWRRNPAIRSNINGIFKGGGAKGILYTGALLELREAGYWFRAVAGSSAGAITATLIAAGLTPEEMMAAVPLGLRGVRRMLAGDLVGSPLYRVERLRTWLESLLQSQLKKLNATPSNNVSFGELYDASGIELYVVSVDVADRQPRVFSPTITPGLSVTAAVIASSAIPMAFRPGRLKVVSPQGEDQIHRLIDGGVWANYPAFIFRESSFRAYHHLAPLPRDSVTLGFTLDTRQASAPLDAVSFQSGMTGAAHDRGGFLPWFVRNPFVRLYFMTLVPLVIVAQTLYTVHAVGLVFLQDYAQRPWVPSWLTSAAAYFDGFFSHFSVGFWSVSLFIVFVALVASVLGATFLDSGLPAMRTLMSVGTDVPYWTGTANDDHVLRLQVPEWLRTTTFRLSVTRISEAVQIGRESTKAQLPAILAEV